MRWKFTNKAAPSPVDLEHTVGERHRIVRCFQQASHLWDRAGHYLELGFGGGHGRKRLAADSIGALVVYSAGAVLAYIAQLAVARVVGADSFGIFAYVLAWTTLLAYVSTLGFHVSLLRFLSTYRARNDWPLARGVLRYTQRRVAGMALSIASLGALVVFGLRHRMPVEMVTAFLIGLAAVPVMALHLLSAAAVRAFGGVLTAIAPERLARDLTLLAVLGMAWLLALAPLDGRLAMMGALAGAAMTLILLRLFMRRLRPDQIDREPEQSAHAEWWQPMLPLGVIMVADNLMCRAGIIVLGLSGNTREAGVFAVAYGIALLTTLPRMAVATVFAPTVSALHARGDRAGLQELSAKAAVLSLIGTLCMAAPLMLLVTTLLVWFGPDFRSGAPVVGILVLGHVVSAACGPQQHLLTMTANESTGARIFAGTAAVNLLGCVLLVEPLGMIGAAIATSVSLMAWNVAMAVLINRKLELAPGLVTLLAGRKSG